MFTVAVKSVNSTAAGGGNYLAVYMTLPRVHYVEAKYLCTSLIFALFIAQIIAEKM